mmetsp:Transcript_39691/g.45194  ORF Transcript_39691/g.45194 Transcript_39691/m.45194 type:complete len:103 (+) Transcript_39691:1609-1917(+)
MTRRKRVDKWYRQQEYEFRVINCRNCADEFPNRTYLSSLLFSARSLVIPFLSEPKKTHIEMKGRNSTNQRKKRSFFGQVKKKGTEHPFSELILTTPSWLAIR